MVEKILDEAEKLLFIKGVKFTVDDICSSLGISKKTVYRYFTSKNDLAKALYTRLFDRYMALLLLNPFDTYETKYDFIITYEKLLYVGSSDVLKMYSLDDDFMTLLDKYYEKIRSLFVTKISHINLTLATNYAFPLMVESLLKTAYQNNNHIEIIKSLIDLIEGLK